MPHKVLLANSKPPNCFCGGLGDSLQSINLSESNQNYNLCHMFSTYNKSIKMNTNTILIIFSEFETSSEEDITTIMAALVATTEVLALHKKDPIILGI